MTAVEHGRTVEQPYAPVWTGVRVVLAAAYVVVLLAGALLHQEQAELSDLYADVERGEVSRVVVRGDIGASSRIAEEVTWETGMRRWRTEAGSDVTADQVRTHVRERGSGVEVVEQGTGGVTVRVLGSRVSDLTGTRATVVVLAAVLSLAGGLVLLFAGPEPWRATRWAWLWLTFIPGGVLVMLVRSGPTPRLSARPPRDVRLSGRRAYGIGLLAGLVGNAGAALALSAVWPAHG